MNLPKDQGLAATSGCPQMERLRNGDKVEKRYSKGRGFLASLRGLKTNGATYRVLKGPRGFETEWRPAKSKEAKPKSCLAHSTSLLADLRAKPQG